MSIADSGNASITHFFSVQTPYQKMRRLGLRTTAFMPLPFSQSALTQTFPTSAFAKFA